MGEHGSMVSMERNFRYLGACSGKRHGKYDLRAALYASTGQNAECLFSFCSLLLLRNACRRDHRHHGRAFNEKCECGRGTAGADQGSLGHCDRHDFYVLIISGGQDAIRSLFTLIGLPMAFVVMLYLWYIVRYSSYIFGQTDRFERWRASGEAERWRSLRDHKPAPMPELN